MFSKSSLILLSLILSSCTLKLNENTSPTTAMNVTPVKQGCLANSGVILNKFSEGKAEEAELTTYWNCLNKSVELFYGNTKSLHDDYYEPQEFVGFLEKYFLNNRKIQPELIKQAMRLKQAIVGGSTDKITKDEFLRTIGLIKKVQKVSMKLRPHMPVSYDALLARNLSNADLELTLSVFEESLIELGQALEGSAGKYDFDEAVRLMSELKLYLYPKETKPTWTDSVIAKLPIIKSAKSVLIAPPAETIQVEDWPKLFYLLPRYLNYSIRVVYYMREPREYLHGIGIERMEKILLDSVDLIDLAISNHPNQRIEKQEFESFWSSLNWENINKNQSSKIKINLNQDSLGNVYKLIFGRFYLDKEFPEAITKKNLAQFREDVLFWTESIRAAEFYYKEKLGEQDYAKKSLPVSAFSGDAKDKLLGFTKEQNATSKTAVDILLQNITKVKTIFPDRHPIVFIPPSTEYDQISFAHIIKIQTLELLNRILYRNYAHDSVISNDELDKMTKELNPILASFGIKMDLSALIKARLLEIKLFLYNSDGQDGISPLEALEIESLLISTMHRANNIHKSIAIACSSNPRNNVLAKIPYKCFRTNFLKRISTYWDFVPGLADHVGKLEDSAQIDLFEKLNSFLRKSRPNDSFVAKDSMGLVLMPYYIEMLFSRFDKNRDGQLDQDEAKLAFPIFKPLIKEKAAKQGYTKDEDLMSIFTFIMAKQTLPDEGWISMGSYAAWSKLSSQQFSIGRSEIVVIFAKLLTK